MSFEITIDDSEVKAALTALAARIDNMQPVMQEIGEDIMERTKRRFGTSTGPDGQRWQPNAASTVLAAIARMGSKARLKNGNLSKKAQKTLAGKKVLVDTGDLAREFEVKSTSRSVTVSNGMDYSAIHQFGGQAGKGKKITIPARPFLPVTSSGEMYPDDQRHILQQIKDYLSDSIP